MGKHPAKYSRNVFKDTRTLGNVTVPFSLLPVVIFLFPGWRERKGRRCGQSTIGTQTPWRTSQLDNGWMYALPSPGLPATLVKNFR